VAVNYEAIATQQDRADAAELTRRGTKGSIPALATIIAFACLGGGAIAAAIVPNAGVLLMALAAGCAGSIVGLPFLALVAYVTKKRGTAMGVETVVRERLMEADADRREFATRLARAFEMTDEEPAAFDVITRAISAVLPDAPTELLLADNSHAHLERVVVASPDGSPPGCRVASPDECVAARRAQTQVFADSEDLDACPMLRGREQGRCSAVCIPVSIMGRTVGVLHSLGLVHEPLGDRQIAGLQSLSNQAGNRLGMLRVVAETRVQASTDGLTGLMNRRSLENRAHQLQSGGVEVAFVMADLDHFKTLNDTFGHEAGDRALRIFSKTVRQGIRGDDLACRYGGEEFAIVLPGADTHHAVEITERIRELLAHASASGDTPGFTASFGIAHSADAADFDDLVRRADMALFAAKEAGRNRTCIDGHTMPVAPTLTALG
jgi:diguanylate cyclase (GGDEF)-like protein